MNLHAIDLNLFLVFQAIYSTRSVTLAGERLSLTQSAVSNALKRLRERFDDPLFVKTNDGMLPTPLAERLMAPITEGLEHLGQAVDIGRHFDHQISNRLFRIAANEIGHMTMLPRLFKSLRNTAPNIRIETISLPLTEIRNGLTNGDIDLAIGSWSQMGASFYQQRLFDETFVIALSRKNPIAHTTLDFNTYLDANHLSFRPEGSTDNELEATLRRAGGPIQRKIVYACAYSHGLFQILKESEYLVTLPSRLGNEAISDNPDLLLLPPPFPIKPFQIRQQWHERMQHDAGHKWLREKVFSIFNDHKN